MWWLDGRVWKMECMRTLTSQLCLLHAPPLEACLCKPLTISTHGMPRGQVNDAWQYRAPTCPQLYLYSDSDPLADPADIEEFIRTQVCGGGGRSWGKGVMP